MTTGATNDLGWADGLLTGTFTLLRRRAHLAGRGLGRRCWGWTRPPWSPTRAAWNCSTPARAWATGWPWGLAAGGGVAVGRRDATAFAVERPGRRPLSACVEVALGAHGVPILTARGLAPRGVPRGCSRAHPRRLVAAAEGLPEGGPFEDATAQVSATGRPRPTLSSVSLPPPRPTTSKQRRPRRRGPVDVRHPRTHRQARSRGLTTRRSGLTPDRAGTPAPPRLRAHGAPVIFRSGPLPEKPTGAP